MECSEFKNQRRDINNSLINLPLMSFGVSCKDIYNVALIKTYSLQTITLKVRFIYFCHSYLLLGCTVHPQNCMLSSPAFLMLGSFQKTENY